MSKFAIVLCAVLFTSANAFPWEESIKKIQLNVEHVINSAILKGEEEYMSNQLETIKVAEDLAEVTSKYGDRIWEDINRITANVTEQINELTVEVPHVNIAECMKISTDLNDITQAAISATSTCLNYKLTAGLEYIKTINKVSYDVVEELSELKEKTQHCANRLDNAKGVSEAIDCLKSASTDATWVSLKAAPKLSVAWNKLKFLLVTLPHHLANCDANKPLMNFYEQSSTAVERTQQCIQHKIEQTRSGLLEPFVPEITEDTHTVADSSEFWMSPK